MSIISRGRLASALLSLAASAAPSFAQDACKGTLVVRQPWSRATSPRADTGAGYLILRNIGRQPDRLISGSSPRAAKVEFHTMKIVDGIMRMRPLPHGVSIAPGAEGRLAPGGEHIMLIGLRAPLKVGESIPLTLRFERAGIVTVSLKVAPAGATGPVEDRR
ncbi:hypothetical protein CAF53_02070 [Sphingobium sp. LB126]|nr:hypothetical protein CAF53_02070 [Sphingobium sp. LB126]